MSKKGNRVNWPKQDRVNSVRVNYKLGWARLGGHRHGHSWADTTGQIGIKGPPKPVVRECRKWHDEGYHRSQSTDGRKGCVMVVVTDDVWPATGRKMT